MRGSAWSAPTTPGGISTRPISSPLHKMSIISYGEDRPVAPNNTAEGRAQNRRVVVRVLA